MYFSKETQETSLKLSRKWEDKVQKSLKNNPDQKERFSSVSDTEIKRLYTPEDIKDINYAEASAFPVNSLICAAIKSPVTGDVIGHSACSPAWAAHKTPISGGKCSCAKVRPGLAPLLIFRLSWDTTATRLKRWAKLASVALP